MERIVIPLSLSKSFESITLSCTCSLSRNVPLCLSISSTKVVLPWSTWAIIATFLRFVLCAKKFTLFLNFKRLSVTILKQNPFTVKKNRQEFASLADFFLHFKGHPRPVRGKNHGKGCPCSCREYPIHHLPRQFPPTRPSCLPQWGTPSARCLLIFFFSSRILLCAPRSIIFVGKAVLIHQKRLQKRNNLLAFKS